MFTHSNEHWLWWSFSSQLGDRFWKEIAVNSWANAQSKFTFAAELVLIKMNADGKLFGWKLLKFVDELKLGLLAFLPIFLERNKCLMSVFSPRRNAKMMSEIATFFHNIVMNCPITIRISGHWNYFMEEI